MTHGPISGASIILNVYGYELPGHPATRSVAGRFDPGPSAEPGTRTVYAQLEDGSLCRFDASAVSQAHMANVVVGSRVTYAPLRDVMEMGPSVWKIVGWGPREQGSRTAQVVGVDECMPLLADRIGAFVANTLHGAAMLFGGRRE